MKLSHLQNMSLVIFDFDGTIADTSAGILDAHKFTLKSMGRETPSDEILRTIIGGNLLKTYMNTFCFDENDARKAVNIYRERYAQKGIFNVALYPGFRELMRELKDSGFKTGVATLKMELFAKAMLKEMGIIQYFDEVCGMDIIDSYNKAGLIKKCVELCGCSKEKTVLIGDTDNDLIGAKQAGVKFIGVTYGFGYKPSKKYDFATVTTPLDIITLLKANQFSG